MNKVTTITKITDTDYPILESIKNRWSPRSFDTKPITENQVKTLLEAGRWAPSCANIQPWRIIWGIKGTEMYDRIFNCLDDFNQSWARNSELLWINAFKKTMLDNKRENFHAIHDLGLFMGNVIHQAQSMGIGAHQMAGVRFKDAQKEFQFSDDYHVATAVAFGYYGGDATKLPKDLESQELEPIRKRNSQQEFAFNGNFKQH